MNSLKSSPQQSRVPQEEFASLISQDRLYAFSVNQICSITIKPVIEAPGGVSDYTTARNDAQAYLYAGKYVFLGPPQAKVCIAQTGKQVYDIPTVREPAPGLKTYPGSLT